MAFNFPENPSDGLLWEDICGNTWVYNEANNSWAKPVNPADVGISPFFREPTGEIRPRVLGDELDMTPGKIDISQYPDA